MLLLLSNCSQRTVPGTDESFQRQAEDLLTHLLSGDHPGLVSSAHRCGKDRVSDDSNVGGIFGPVTDKIGCAVLSVPGSVAVCYSETAELDKIIGTIALIHC